MQIARNGAGFALPMTIVSLTVLALLAATGYLVSWMDLRSARAQSTGTRAYLAAEAGLATALAQIGVPPPSRTVALSDGAALVRSTRLLGVGARGGLYLLASTGSVDDAGAVFSRTLSRVIWAAGPPVFDAAISIEPAALPATVTAGSAGGVVTGFPPGCARPPGAAIVAAGAVSTGAVSVTGAPPITSPGPRATAAARTGLRWGDIRSGVIPPPDAVVPGDPWPPPGSGWPLIRLLGSGPLGPGHSGQGVIAADGDLEIANGFSWTGVILVGGSLRLYGDTQLRGAVMVGLDTTLPATVDLGDGIISVAFDPCMADLAARRLVPYPAAIPGMWRDSW